MTSARERRTSISAGGAWGLGAVTYRAPGPGAPPPRRGAAVARRAEDVVALPAAREHRGGDGHRELVRERAVDLARVEQLVGIGQRIARDRVRDRHPRGLAVGEERARLERLVPRGVVHVLTARSKRNAGHDQREVLTPQLPRLPADEGPSETTRSRGDRTSDPWTRCRGRTG